MKNFQNKELVVVFFATLLIGIGWMMAVSYPLELGLCQYTGGGGSYCSQIYAERLVAPLGLLALAVLLSLVPLFFLKESVYKAWRKFAIWAVPLMLVLTLITSPTGGNMFIANEQEFVSILFSILFVVISYAIIAWKAFSMRKKESPEST